MANPALSTLTDAFTAATINTAVWNSVTGGAATLDTTNDLVSLAVPTTNGATNTFGTTRLFDATSSAVYAEICAAPNGNGGTRTAMQVTLDANNAVSIRLENGVFLLRLRTAAANVDTTLATYSPHTHRWWRLRESVGTWYAEASPDGLNWTTYASKTYTWSATGVSVQFQTGANVTEAAGNVATIGNVNCRAGGQFNLNWPNMEYGWGPFWGANNGSGPLDRFVEITDRTEGTSSVQRGRQYETDQVRSGEASVTLNNKDAALDPTNAGSPWAGHILPYQPYRQRAQWPPSRNLLDQVAATGGDLGGFTGTISSNTSDIFSATDTTGGSFVSTATAWSGSTAMQFAVPISTAATARLCHTPRYSVIPGKTYTVQLRVRNVTASTSLDVQAFIGWYTIGTGTPTTITYGTTSTLTGSTTAGWTYLSFTATAPANAAGIDVGVATASTAAAAVNIQVDGWQLEKGAVASAWTCPGAWFGIYQGWTERWPSTWDMDGTYALVQPTAVDTFSLLSQRQLNDALTMEINSSGSPRFLYKLDDPSGSTTLADWTGNNPAAQIGISKYGAGSITFGAAITATDTANGIYTGSSGTVSTINNSNPGTSLTTGGASFLKLSSAGILGPTDPSQWTRMFAFRYTAGAPSSQACLWSSFSRARSGGFPTGAQMYWTINGSGLLNLVLGGPTTTTAVRFTPSSTNVVSDGNWHLALVSYSRANATLIITLDGVTVSYPGFDPTLEPSGLISDNVGAWVDPTVANGTTYNVQGNMSFIAEWSTTLSGTTQRNIYSAWKSACAGESTNARYQRILRYAGYTGNSNVQTGLTTSMGPANTDGQDALTALQGCVDTENGAHYVDTDGSVTFRSRSARYNALTPAYIFGEKPELGEWPYELLELDFDSTHLSNDVTVTQEGTQQAFYASDDASQAAYFPRTMSRTINASSPDECQDASNYLLSRYRQPATRVSALKLHPSGNPALWAVCLSLNLGTRIRVMRRAPGAPTTQIECFVENISWEFDDDNEAWLTLQCSPADLTPYGLFAAWHTTLAAAVTVGAASITINAPAGAVGLLASQQLAQGQQLVLGQNTANAETVTVSSVAATSVGWTTAVVTLTSTATKTHAIGDTVCEPLPSGTTDPTTWDSAAQFDSIAFAY
ncbi:hypothetical protein ACUXZZ_45595 (plasmid) [Streptomyces graminifolii]|uniref:hypothetical protein n=1 Tax=Streptomyces graminifolii TaxID=1266771 RepID=UPI00405931DB